MSESYKETHGISYREAVKAHLEFMHNTHMRAYTFDPVNRIGFCAGTKEHAKEMHRRYSNGTDPLYVIGVTNHIGMPDDEMESTYNNLRKQGTRPFFGRWIGYNNLEFTDISYPLNHGIHETKIIDLKMMNVQQSILKIIKDGSVTYI